MKNLTLLFFLFAILSSCVKAKIYRAESEKRKASEARETVLNQELAARKNETAALTDRTEQLAKNVGRLEAELVQAKAQVSNQSAVAQASTSKLLEEKNRLETALSEKTRILAERENLLSRINFAQKKRDSTLQNIRDELAIALSQANFTTVFSEIIDGQAVRVTLPDNLVFDEKGLMVSTSGVPLLQIIGNFLATRPDLQTAIVAHTDNIFPKEKGLTIRDSRDWSLLRANVVGRVLSREFNVNDNQLSFIGRGEFFPVASNETPEGRAENRRTEVVFYPKLMEIPRK